MCDRGVDTSTTKRPRRARLRLSRGKQVINWNREPAAGRLRTDQGRRRRLGHSYDLNLGDLMGVLTTIFALVATAAVASAAPQDAEAKHPVKRHYPCKREK